MSQRRYLNNMSQRPRSQVHIAPGRLRRQTVTAGVNALGLQAGPAFVSELAAALGLGERLSAADARVLLEQATERELDAHDIPPAAVVVIPSRDSLTLPPLLSVALLSRSSGRLMMRGRRPLFTPRAILTAHAGLVIEGLLGVAQ